MIVTQLILLNTFLLALIAFALMRISNRTVRFSFCIMALAAMSCMSPIMLVRSPGLDAAALSFLFHMIWFTGGILSGAAASFLMLFAKPHLLKSKLFWLNHLHTAFMLSFSFGDYFVAGVGQAAHGPTPLYGLWHGYYLCTIVFNQAAALSIFTITFFRTGNETVKFQMKHILLSFTSGVLFFMFTNLLMPRLTGSSQTSWMGPFSALICAFGIVYIIANTKRILISRKFMTVLAEKNEERLNFGRNFAALGEVADFLLFSRIHDVREIFLNAGGEMRRFRLERKNAESEGLEATLDTSNIPLNVAAGLFENMQDLKKNNMNLLFALKKAESEGRAVDFSAMLDGLNSIERDVFHALLHDIDVDGISHLFGLDREEALRICRKLQIRMDRLAPGLEFVPLD